MGVSRDAILLQVVFLDHNVIYIYQISMLILTLPESSASIFLSFEERKKVIKTSRPDFLYCRVL